MRFAIRRFVARAAVLPLVIAGGARAQIPTPVIKGDVTLKSGTQPPPGVHVANLFSWYDANKVKLRNGDSRDNGSFDGFNDVVSFTYVSKAKLFGANWGLLMTIPFANFALDLPQTDVHTEWGPSDVRIVPLYLGWHVRALDAVLGFGLFLPTGRYAPGADDNSGMGMWSNEYAGGVTWYPSKDRHWNVATLLRYNVQSAKSGSTARAGSTLTLQGGAGYGFAHDVANVGLAYYAQWKVTRDEGIALPPALDAKARMFAIGPQLDLPSTNRLPLLGSLKYLVEMGNRVATQGNTLFFTVTVAEPARP